MKIKTIKSILNKVHQDFVNSIEDSEVKKLVKDNSIITGGCIVSMLLGEKVNDYDYYFTNKETCIKVAEYYINRFNKNTENSHQIELKADGDRVKVFVRSTGIAIDDKVESIEGVYEPVCLTSNAISLTNDVQLVLRFYGDAEEIHKNYDYIHATSYWTSYDNDLVLRKEALESILTKELIYSGSKYPLCSILRSKKFINRGWTINAGQYLKMVLQLNELDLSNLDILEEQLTGVDSAYFSLIISALKNKKASDPSFKPDNSYIFELINRIFQ